MQPLLNLNTRLFRPALKAVLVCLLAVAFATNLIHAQETPEEARKRLKLENERLEKIKARKQGLSKRVQNLSQERARLNGLLIDMAKRIQKSESALTNLEGKLSYLETQQKQIRRSMKARHKTIGEMLGLLQRMGRNPPPVMSTHRDDALKMIRSAMLMSDLLPKLKKQADNLNKELSTLITLRENIRIQTENLKQQTAELAKDREKIETLLSEKNHKLLTQNKELQEIEAKAAEHAKSVASLSTLIERLDAEVTAKTKLGEYEKQLALNEEEAKKRLSKGAVEIKPSSKKTAFVNPGRIKPALPFAHSKGTLPLPVSGKRLRSYGERTQYGDTSKGIAIETRLGAQITSPSDGWIVYAGKFRSYGQLLIINAGAGYHILLAGLNRIDVKTAQFVLAGEPIGMMKRSAHSDQTNTKTKHPILYIEFRKKGQPFDPDPWWSKETEVKPS